jgi:hypothetical protein
MPYLSRNMQQSVHHELVRVKYTFVKCKCIYLKYNMNSGIDIILTFYYIDKANFRTFLPLCVMQE